MDASYVMGLDLGQPGEPTGFAVLEWPATDDPTPESPYHLRHLERFPPGTSYPAILEAVADRAGRAAPEQVAAGRRRRPRSGGRSSTACTDSACRVIPIVIGAGHTPHWVDWVGQMVPKKDLVTACNWRCRRGG